MIISYIHKHSLDNNDFNDKFEHEFELQFLKGWIEGHGPIIFNPSGRWQGMHGLYDYESLELIHYEP